MEKILFCNTVYHDKDDSFAHYQGNFCNHECAGWKFKKEPTESSCINWRKLS